MLKNLILIASYFENFSRQLDTEVSESGNDAYFKMKFE